MRHLLLTLLALLMTTGHAMAGPVDDIRVYLNPGHGSWGPNDRPCATIPYPNLPNIGMPDTCGFYESNTNLWKVLKLGERLEQAGLRKENILYSRRANGPYPYVKGAPDAEQYNRNLSEICEEVDANNIDLFLSVHSNAATEGSTTNYPLFLYRGTDGANNDAVQGSRDMACTMWPLFFTNGIDPQSHLSAAEPNVRGDVSFYGSVSTRPGTNYRGYLGVLKHGARGFLSEGYFHTYQPARHRALNSDYCGQEGVRYARGIVKYLKGFTSDVRTETTGAIVGTVKDLHERIVNDLFRYAPDTNDQWLPVNGAKVALLKGGQPVATYQVDNNYNGVFVFDGLAPGTDYTLDITADGYKPLFDEHNLPITVVANQTTYPMVYLEATGYVAPVITYDNYPEPELPGYISGLPQPLPFTQTVAAPIEGVKGVAVKTLHYGDSVFVLTRDDARQAAVYLVQRSANSVQAVSMKGLDATALADIALTADGQLVASVPALCTANGAEPGHAHSVYRWLKPDADPLQWFSSTTPASFQQATVGQAITVNGPSRDCKVVLSAVEQRTDGGASAVALMQFAMTGEMMNAAQSCTLPDELHAAVSPQGQLFSLRVSPRDDGHIIINADGAAPFEVAMPQQADGTLCTLVGQMATDVLGTRGAEAGFFRYAHRAFMVAPYSTDAEGTLQGLRLVDITQGLDHASIVRTTGTDVSGARANACAVTAWADGEGDIKAWLVNAQGRATFSTSAADLPSGRSTYAYGLGMSEAGGTYTLTFKLSGPAQRVQVQVTATDDASRCKLFTVDHAQEGDNAISISQYDIPEGECRWAVLVENQPVAVAQCVFENSKTTLKYSTRGGVAFVRDANSAAFGKVVVSNGNSLGFDVYSPTLQHEGNYHAGMFANTVSSTGRIAENGGLIYAADWSDQTSGFYVLDPSHPDTAPYQLYEGERQSDGAFVVDGNIIGGGATGCDFVGTGADRKMVTFVEDYPEGNAGQKLVMYAIGEHRTIGFGPEKVYDDISRLMLNTNVEVRTLPQGMFVSQVRGEGTNSAGVPGFVFADYDGNVLFNSGRDFKELVGSTAGLAVNAEGNLLAVGETNVGIRVCQIEWGEGNVPKLTTLYHIKNSLHGTEITQLDFDVAGNLYGYARGQGLRAFSVFNPLCPVPVATSPAPDALTMTGVKRTEMFTTTAEGYATYAADIAVDYGDHALTVYTLTVNDEQTMATGREFVGVVPAGKAVLVKGNANTTYTLDEATTAADDSFTTSLQSGATTADGTQYGFTTEGGSPVFRQVTIGHLIPEKKGYLVLTGMGAGAKLRFAIEDDTPTGIGAIEAGAEGSALMYNTAGQRVDKAYKGIVIVNGRKYLKR